jgi:hypothetical protein
MLILGRCKSPDTLRVILYQLFANSAAAPAVPLEQAGRVCYSFRDIMPKRRITAPARPAPIQLPLFAETEVRNFLRYRSRINQHVFATYRRFHFLRRTATVLSVLEAA